jgi:MFS family permease
LGVWRELLRLKPQQAALTLQVCLFTGYACELGVVTLHAAQTWGATPGDLGMLFAGVWALGMVFAPVGGWLADRYSAQWAHTPYTSYTTRSTRSYTPHACATHTLTPSHPHRIGRKETILPALCLSALGLACSAAAASWTQLVVALCVLNVGSNMLLPAMHAYVIEASPNDEVRGRSLALQRQAGDLVWIRCH